MKQESEKMFCSLRGSFLLLLFCVASFIGHGSSALAVEVKTHLQLGDDAFGHGKYEKAIAEYSEQIKLNPNDAEAYYDRGHAYICVGKNDLADQDLNKAIELYS